MLCHSRRSSHRSDAPPPGCTEAALSASLQSIRHRLDAVAFGYRKVDTAQLVEEIRKATACLVWSETHDSSLFNLFCEHTMLAGFVAALRAASPVPVKLQILQTLSILVQNAQRDTSFIYLLSQGLLNDFFDDPPANMDEEALAYFITLLKGIAFRLDGQLALLCLQRNPRRGCGYEGATPSTSSASPTATPSPSEGPSLRMPIFERSVRLIGHPDPMVQTSARSAALRLLSFEGPVKGAVEPAAAGLLAPAVAEVACQLHFRDQKAALAQLLDFAGDLFNVGIPSLHAALEQEGFSATADAAVWRGPMLLLRQAEGHPAVRVFEKPAEGAAVLGEIPNEELSACLGPHGHFLRVKWRDLDGWVGRKNVRLVREARAPALQEQIKWGACCSELENSSF
ncbi:unnamed protein product [Effrenium voratum]|nr:unnamed protein product [Effrenium voratum]